MNGSRSSVAATHNETFNLSSIVLVRGYLLALGRLWHGDDTLALALSRTLRIETPKAIYSVYARRPPSDST